MRIAHQLRENHTQLFRINDEHRMIYKVTEEAVLIAQLRYHYQA